MIRLSHISLKAGDFALSDISLSIPQGSFNVLLGPTGSGKTLLLELIAGLKKADTGTICIDNTNVTHLPPESRNIGYVPQDIALFPHLNVYDNIAYGLQFDKTLHKNAQKEKVKELAAVLEIAPLLHRNISGLSGGEKQRVALARALSVHKPILLLDEPTAAIHETLQEELCLFIKKIQQQFSLTVLMTTHHKDSAFFLADTIHFIDQGKLFLSTEKANFYDQPMSKNVAAFFGVKNIFPVQVSGRDHGVLHTWCAALHTTLTFTEDKHPKHNSFSIGVRPEDIRVVKEEDRANTTQNTFEARVTSVLLKENNAVIKLEPLHTQSVVTMDISIYNQRKFDITEGKIIQCKIKAEAIRMVY